MGYEAVQSLLDRALPDEERQDIITIVTALDRVPRGCRAMRSRW
jgi:ferrous-iron efflux pump FieF